MILEELLDPLADLLFLDFEIAFVVQDDAILDDKDHRVVSDIAIVVELDGFGESWEFLDLELERTTDLVGFPGSDNVRDRKSNSDRVVGMRRVDVGIVAVLGFILTICEWLLLPSPVRMFLSS